MPRNRDSYSSNAVTDRTFLRSRPHDSHETSQVKRLLDTAQELHVYCGRRKGSRKQLPVTPAQHNDAAVPRRSSRFAAIIFGHNVGWRTFQGHAKKATIVEPVTKSRHVYQCIHLQIRARARCRTQDSQHGSPAPMARIPVNWWNSRVTLIEGIFRRVCKCSQLLQNLRVGGKWTSSRVRMRLEWVDTEAKSRLEDAATTGADNVLATACGTSSIASIVGLKTAAVSATGSFPNEGDAMEPQEKESDAMAPFHPPYRAETT